MLTYKMAIALRPQICDVTSPYVYISQLMCAVVSKEWDLERFQIAKWPSRSAKVTGRARMTSGESSIVIYVSVSYARDHEHVPKPGLVAFTTSDPETDRARSVYYGANTG